MPGVQQELHSPPCPTAYMEEGTWLVLLILYSVMVCLTRGAVWVVSFVVSFVEIGWKTFVLFGMCFFFIQDLMYFASGSAHAQDCLI